MPLPILLAFSSSSEVSHSVYAKLMSSDEGKCESVRRVLRRRGELAGLVNDTALKYMNMGERRGASGLTFSGCYGGNHSMGRNNFQEG